MILIIDHFDSFSHNLYQAIADIQDTVVVRCNAISPREIEEMNPQWVVLSPGPKGPKDTGVTLEYLRSKHGRSCPTLGICLGFQAMALEWGAQVVKAAEVVHGKTLSLSHDEHPYFENCPNPMPVARYHSLCVPSANLPPELQLHAEHQGMAMAVSDPHKPWVGLQFHPESFLTPQGKTLLHNIFRQQTQHSNHNPSSSPT